MNHDCHGDTFKLEEVTFWRCLGNGNIVESPPSEEVCPNCKRPKTGADKIVEVVDVRTQREVRLESWPDDWFPLPPEESREERAFDALIVAAMRGVDIPDLVSREQVLESLLHESLGWLKTYKCGEGDRLIPRIERALNK